MSSTSGSKNNDDLFAKIGLVPRSTRCSHGCPIPAGQASASYPFNATAKRIVERFVDHFEECGSTRPYNAVQMAVNDLSALKLDAKQKEYFLKTFIMIGTDAVRQHQSSGVVNNLSHIFLAKNLAFFLLIIEKVWNEPNKDKVKHKVCQQLLNLDSSHDIILFYDSRIPCSCLNQAKELDKVRMGYCRNPTCQKFFLDAKLLTCSGCLAVKYCSKECQVAHWGFHKKLCKDLQKKKQGGSQSKSG